MFEGGRVRSSVKIEEHEEREEEHGEHEEERGEREEEREECGGEYRL